MLLCGPPGTGKTLLGEPTSLRRELSMSKLVLALCVERAAHKSLLRAERQGAQRVVLCGPPGTGKTLLGEPTSLQHESLVSELILVMTVERVACKLPLRAERQGAPSSVLLCGPPGTGKRLLGEQQQPIIS